MQIRDKIKTLRQSQKWSQEYVAEKLGMSPNGYGALERGDTDLTLEKLKTLSDLYKVELKELVDENEKSNVFSLLAGKDNQSNAQFQINIYAGDVLDTKNELEKARILIESKDRELKEKNDQVASLRKIIELLENKNETL